MNIRAHSCRMVFQVCCANFVGSDREVVPGGVPLLPRQIERKGIFAALMGAGAVDVRLTADPRQMPPREAVDGLVHWSRHFMAIREACAGLLSKMTVDWQHGSVEVEMIVPRHIDPTAMNDALALRLAVIERRMGLAHADEQADHEAVERLKVLLPPPSPTES